MKSNRPTLVILSGYFNPIHAGHLDMIEAARDRADKLIVIVNNDEQQRQKKGKVVQNEQDRKRMVQSLESVDEAVLSVDKDPTVIESLRMVAGNHPEHQILFANGGDRNSKSSIPESDICEEFSIEMVFDMGGDSKHDSSTRINAIYNQGSTKDSKKAIAFDLDNTLAESKTPITPEVAKSFMRLLEHKIVCVISGGKFEQFEYQLLNQISGSGKHMKNLYLFPTCGTQHYRFQQNLWCEIYREEIPKEDKKRIAKAMEASARKLKMWSNNPAGEVIEDRGSQITFSALGQQATTKDKEAWDPDQSKKEALRNEIASLINDYDVKVGGTTSIDVTGEGIDKAYGMNKFKEFTGFSNTEILYVGDRIQPGGNDYPVQEMGIDCVALDDYTQIKPLLDTLNLL